jgi:hypothetical protein
VEPPIVEFAGESYGSVMQDVPFEKVTQVGISGGSAVICCAATPARLAAAAILDVDRERVLLSVNEQTMGGVAAADVADELSPVLLMSWAEFQSFVRRHPKRRYLL